MVLLNRNLKRQMNLMVSLRMCSTKINIAKSRFQIDRLIHEGLDGGGGGLEFSNQ